MNGLKALKGTAVALSLLALAGCGQAYNPGPEDHEVAPRAPGDVFDNNADAAPYQTVSYEALRALLTDFLGVQDNTNFAGTPCANLAVGGCPLLAPVAYLQANRNSLGIATYTDDPLSTVAPSLMTSGGFKVWILASSSACGIAMEGSKYTELFPNGPSDVTLFYQLLLGRSPNAGELAEIDALQSSFAEPQKQAAAVCSVAMAGLENLGAN